MSNFSSEQETKKISVFSLALGSIISVIMSLGMILVFALVIKWFNLSDSIITPVNIFIKIISIAIGVFVVTRDGKQGFIKGLLVGLIYVVCCYVIFSLLLGSFSLTASNFLDLVLGLVSGAICGIMFVNLKK